MIRIKTKKGWAILADIRKHSSKELLTIACHKRRIKGNIAILETYSKGN